MHGYLPVVLGSNKPLHTSEGIERKMKNVAFHPEYNYPESYYDVAIATLNETVPEDAFKTIRPICLPRNPIQNKGLPFLFFQITLR